MVREFFSLGFSCREAFFGEKIGKCQNFDAFFLRPPVYDTLKYGNILKYNGMMYPYILYNK